MVSNIMRTPEAAAYFRHEMNLISQAIEQSAEVLREMYLSGELSSYHEEMIEELFSHLKLDL